MQGFGLLDIHDAQARVDEHTNFKIGSISKVFTAMAVMQLQEQGLLHIQDPLIQYLPWFSTKDEALSKHITIEHLLTHTSGLPDRLNAHDIASTDIDNIQEAIQEKLQAITLTHSPGEAIEYTNMNMDLLQVLIEVVTGEAFPDYMEAHLFRPLGMDRTGYYDVMEEDLPNTAMGHRTHWGKLTPYDDRFVYASSGSSGLSTNVADLGAFITFVLNEGQTTPGVLSSESLRAMQKVSTYYPDDSVGYGYGWLITPRTFEHAGGRPGFTANIILSSDLQYGFALLANSKQNITDETNYNIYSILNGEAPRELRLEDYPKISPEATFVITVTLIITAFMLSLAGIMIYCLARGRLSLALRKPRIWKLMIWIAFCIVYSYIMYVIYVYLPHAVIGVPYLFAFQLDPDLTSGLFLFSIAATGLFLVASVYLLLLENKQKIIAAQHAKKSRW